jgi:hypothetical protein
MMRQVCSGVVSLGMMRQARRGKVGVGHGGIWQLRWCAMGPGAVWYFSAVEVRPGIAQQGRLRPGSLGMVRFGGVRQGKSWQLRSVLA